jgi:SAM-dependent methyltransferase
MYVCSGGGSKNCVLLSGESLDRTGRSPAPSRQWVGADSNALERTRNDVTRAIPTSKGHSYCGEQEELENTGMLQYVTESEIEDGLVLDLGSKDGRKTRSTATEVVAVDIDFGDRVEAEHLTFVRGDARQLPFLPNSFDVIIADQLLEHVRDIEAVVGEIARVLKPGGTTYVAFPHRFAPTRPHDLPRWFSMLPRRVRARVVETFEPSVRHYALEGVWPLSPIRARKIFETQFESVEHATLDFRRRHAERYVSEGATGARLFEYVRPLIERLASTRVGSIGFEILWPHPEYRLENPIRSE